MVLVTHAQNNLKQKTPTFCSKIFAGFKTMFYIYVASFKQAVHTEMNLFLKQDICLLNHVYTSLNLSKDVFTLKKERNTEGGLK